MIEQELYLQHLEMFRSKHKSHDYYTTAQIIKITGTSERTVRARISKLKQTEGKKHLLIQDDITKHWLISKLIVDDFYSKYKPRKATRYNQPWQSFITWVMRDSYLVDVHNYLINKVKEAFPTQDPNKEWSFVIEKTKRGVNHVHGLSLLHYEELFPVIHQIIKDAGIDEDSYDVLVGQVENRHCAERYLRKDPQNIGWVPYNRN